MWCLNSREAFKMRDFSFSLSLIDFKTKWKCNIGNLSVMWPLHENNYLYICILSVVFSQKVISVHPIYLNHKDIGLSLATFNAQHFCLASNYEKSPTSFPKYDAMTGLLIVTLLHYWWISYFGNVQMSLYCDIVNACILWMHQHCFRQEVLPCDLTCTHTYSFSVSSQRSISWCFSHRRDRVNVSYCSVIQDNRRVVSRAVTEIDFIVLSSGSHLQAVWRAKKKQEFTAAICLCSFFELQNKPSSICLCLQQWLTCV